MSLLHVIFRVIFLVTALASSLVAVEDVKPMPDPVVLLERVMASLKTLAPRRESNGLPTNLRRP